MTRWSSGYGLRSQKLLAAEHNLRRTDEWRQTAEQRFTNVEQELRSAEDRIQKTATDQYLVLEQRLQAAEPKILTAEQNWRRADDWRQSGEQRFTSIEQQLHISEHRIQQVEDQHGIVEQRLQAAAQKTVQVEQNCRRTDERLQTTEQRSKETDEHLQATLQRLQDLQQQLTDAVSHIRTFEPNIKNWEERLQRNTGLLFETKKTFDKEATRRENVEISIGTLSQQIEQLKADLAKVSDGRLKSLQAMLGSNRRMQAFAMVAWIMSLILVGYIGIGNRGSSILTQYLSQWVPGLFI